jgi:murein DD-endopeptidase MepM/ murein hydrolase activator NlpD
MKYISKIFFALFIIAIIATPALAEKKRHVAKVDYNAPSAPQKQISLSELGEDFQVNEDCEDVGSICLTSYVSASRVIITAENKGFAVRTLNIDYFLNNMRQSMNSEGKNIIIKPGEKKKIEELFVEDKSYSFTFNYSFTSYFGVVDAIHNDKYVYDLPFEAGEKRLLWQGIGGKFTHSDEANYHAYDFKMPIGTPVLAARSGTVVDIVDEFTQGGVDASLKNKMNYVYIQHADGTIANYSHIKPNGALVNIGDEVQKGQKIALSGNTGYTTNPHLHFGVFKVIRGGKYKSVPIKIRTAAGVKISLKAGEYVEK